MLLPKRTDAIKWRQAKQIVEQAATEMGEEEDKKTVDLHATVIEQEEILRLYEAIMKEEKKISFNNWDILPAKEIYGIVLYVFEVAKNGLVSRSCNSRCGYMKPGELVLESDGAHTNLVQAIVQSGRRHLELKNYALETVTDAIIWHDLPENVTGDIPDDGQRNEAAKAKFERKYFKNLSQYASPHNIIEVLKIQELLSEMANHSSDIPEHLLSERVKTGRFLYLADKVSFIVSTLCYRYYNKPLLAEKKNPMFSDRDRREMAICDYQEGGFCRYSEMVTIDYFKERKHIEKDYTGYFTALIVMLTLFINKRWYRWRIADYYK